ncbi:FtsW/RodA/SpoVE family cell cycle protein [Gordonia zhaorongruii]|uniref:FtsW/RodA/SpoVE family cell cycle protein n=1 Tax=Gordonia zhaorongruii TaxID=2597659 RepID=UPI0010441D48|nr:FtsW/RodA/SpoVE family cell cycle protein [Gordonia zhaorongruii]
MTSAPQGHAPPDPPPTSTGRNTELMLLVFAVAIVSTALVIVESAQGDGFSAEILKFIAAYAALCAIAHFIVRRFAPYADPLLLPLVATLNGLGLVMIHRLDLGSARSDELLKATERTNNADQQLLWAFVGILVFAATVIVIRDHRTLSRYAYTLGLGGLIFLALPAILPSSMSEINGSKIWIRTPLFNIQPGEFSKILIIVFTAAFLVSRRDLFTTAGKQFAGIDFPRARDLGPLLGAWVIAVGVLAFESDLGTSLLIFATVLTMLYVATGRVSWLMLGFTLFALAAVVAYQLFFHLQMRVAVWRDPFEQYDTYGYQVAQSLFGFATGGMFGTGLGSGRPNIVPFANTDFILTSFGEEIGLVGLTAIVMLYLLFVIRGLRTAIAVRDSFGKLLAAGLSFTIVFQLFVVFGGVSKLIPLTGLTTPFLAYGGSSLLANYLLLALLIRISNAAREPDAPKVKPKRKVEELATRMVQRS